MPLDYKDSRVLVANRIKCARSKAKLTQVDVATALGITPQAISNYERGVNGVPNNVIYKMAELFGVTVDYLIGISDVPIPIPHDISALLGSDAVRLTPAELQKVMETVDKSVPFGEDALCTFPTLLGCRKVVVMNEVFYHYRHHGASVSNAYNGKLLGKVLLLGEEMKKQFDMREFEDGGQLDGYVAMNSLFFIRKELTENKNATVKERMRIVRSYIDNPVIGRAFGTLSTKSRDEKLRTKARMIRKKRVKSLFVSLALKDRLTKLRGKKNEN